MRRQQQHAPSHTPIYRLAVAAIGDPVVGEDGPAVRRLADALVERGDARLTAIIWRKYVSGDPTNLVTTLEVLDRHGDAHDKQLAGRARRAVADAGEAIDGKVSRCPLACRELVGAALRGEAVPHGMRGHARRLREEVRRVLQRG